MPPASPIRTLLVQDRVPANQAVLTAVERSPALVHLGTIWTLERVHQAMRMQSPELVLVDWNLAAASASHVCHVIKLRLLAPKVIAVVPTDDLFHRHGAALSGADALVARQAIDAGLERALAVVFPGRVAN
jgi:DNA-binding response OmpR family regulator